jgi:hypothetical protein
VVEKSVIFTIIVSARKSDILKRLVGKCVSDLGGCFSRSLRAI